MVNIKSYIFFNKKAQELKGREGMQLISENPSDFFIDISDSEINNIDLSGSYLEGAIVIEYNYISLLDFKDYDLIVQFWTYIIHLIQSYQKNKEAETCFPDQPRRIVLKDGMKGLIFSVDDSEFIIKNIDREVFFSELINAGKLFFKRLSEVKRDENFKYQLDCLSKLEGFQGE